MLAEKIANYTVLSTLDGAGRSEVYLAEDPATHRKVAIKMMGQRILSDPAALRRFQKETANAAGLTHPGIVAVHESGSHYGRPFVVMEYVDGQSLTKMLATGGALPILAVLRIGTAVADVLRHAHQRGIVHREMTCSHIMMTADGTVKLLEFGLSVSDGGKRVVTSGASPEDAAHWSPEVVDGGVAGAASDIWCLGLVMYECLTGKLPFRSESTSTVMQKIRSETPARPSALRSGVPADLESIVLRCLEKDPARRYASAADLLAALRPGETPAPLPMQAEQKAVAREPAAVEKQPVPAPVARPEVEQPRDVPAPAGPRRSGRNLVVAAILVVLALLAWFLSRLLSGGGGGAG